MTEFPPKSEFRKWLRSLPPDAVVADDWSCFRCPLAEWLTRSGIAVDKAFIRPSPEVGGVWQLDGGDTQPLPDWANVFGNGIDEIGHAGCIGSEGFGPVTAADCLAVLRRTPRA